MSPWRLLLSRLKSSSSLSFLVVEVFQYLNHLCGLLLGSLQYVHVSLVLWSQKLDIVLQAWPRQC